MMTTFPHPTLKKRKQLPPSSFFFFGEIEENPSHQQTIDTTTTKKKEIFYYYYDYYYYIKQNIYVQFSRSCLTCLIGMSCIYRRLFTIESVQLYSIDYLSQRLYSIIWIQYVYLFFHFLVQWMCKQSFFYILRRYSPTQDHSCSIHHSAIKWKQRLHQQQLYCVCDRVKRRI